MRAMGSHERALAGLFGEVLALCADAGLVRVGVIAVDGTKVAANAAPQATRDYEQIAREILAEADAVDAEEDEQFGEARGDELPPELATAQGRRGSLRGIMHSFTGDAEMAAECVALGLHISFAGMVTYKKSQPLRDCAATVPADRVLIETDCPYLSPEPVRGQRPNEPALLVHTATCIAIARGVSPQELARQTTANARALFRIAD